MLYYNHREGKEKKGKVKKMKKMEEKKMYEVAGYCFDNWNEAFAFADRWMLTEKDIEVVECEVYKLNPIEKLQKKVKRLF